MKKLLVGFMGAFFLTGVLFADEPPPPVKANCQCKDCQCNYEGHCGCMVEDTCSEDCRCSMPRK